VRHRWEDWRWDETVFEGTASYYRRGRNPYAPGIGEALAGAVGLDGRGRLLDVGCGPGTLTRLFAHLFEEVIGLDSDPGMIVEARIAADEAEIENATWACMLAEDLPGGLGTSRVVTFGQSFHWMDRTTVASVVHGMLQPGGEVVQVDSWHDPPPELHREGPNPSVPRAAINELRVKYLGAGQAGRKGFSQYVA
jgi:2-polyprenyl-3-methyl-5-hydroxy-6-metoxy-1,4-benzoquinol methylase